MSWSRSSRSGTGSTVVIDAEHDWFSWGRRSETDTLARGPRAADATRQASSSSGGADGLGGPGGGSGGRSRTQARNWPPQLLPPESAHPSPTAMHLQYARETSPPHWAQTEDGQLTSNRTAAIKSRETAEPWWMIGGGGWRSMEEFYIRRLLMSRKECRSKHNSALMGETIILVPELSPSFHAFATPSVLRPAIRAMLPSEARLRAAVTHSNAELSLTRKRNALLHPQIRNSLFIEFHPHMLLVV